MEFVNRKSELEFLEREYNLSDASLIILYGRRRIGKTALMTEFGKNKEYLYFLATKEAEIENRETFKEIVANFTGNEWLKEIPAPKWETLFKAWADNQPERRKLLFIDEFQFLGKSNPAFPSIFQK
ncbi:MAG: ATP-binding protein, partial [Eubacterium sp.]